MLIARCDICKAESDQTVGDDAYTGHKWPDPEGSHIEFTVNSMGGSRRFLLACPACTRKLGLPTQGESRRGGCSAQQRDELTQLIVEKVLDLGKHAFRDMADEAVSAAEDRY